MTKNDIASYLVSLHTLIEAQTKGQVSIASNILAEEYEKHWGLLKTTIQKENEHEARQSQRQRQTGSEDRAGIEGSIPGSGKSDRQPGEIGRDVSRPKLPRPDEG